MYVKVETSEVYSNDNWEISKMRVTNKEIDRKRVLDTREDFP